MNRTALSLAAAAFLTTAGCVSEDPGTPETKTSLGTAPAGDLTVELFTDTRLETGMTPIYVKVTTATGDPVTDATVDFEPDMTSMSHGAPVIGTAMSVDEDGFYRCDVVFQMGGTWSATVGVARPPLIEPAQASFPELTVTDTGRARGFVGSDGGTYVVSLNFGAEPREGLNPVVVTLHERQGPYDFVPVDDATIHLSPWMPAHQHGADGSIDPALALPGSGVYEGQLKFSMMGDWEATLHVSRQSVEIGAPVFSVTVN